MRVPGEREAAAFARAEPGPRLVRVGGEDRVEEREQEAAVGGDDDAPLGPALEPGRETRCPRGLCCFSLFA